MHKTYWTQVKDKAEERICDLFADCDTDVSDILGHDNGIESIKDARKILAYILRHGNCDEQACAIISVGEWIHSVHELNEHGMVSAEPVNNTKE